MQIGNVSSSDNMKMSIFPSTVQRHILKYQILKKWKYVANLSNEI